MIGTTLNEALDLRYCKKCVTPNTRPNVFFREDGVCEACHFVASNSGVDWDRRLEELRRILDSNRKSVGPWDCIVGVSGGKDSTRQAIWVREKLDYKVLLVNVSYPPRQLSEVGALNISNLINLGFDCEHILPAPKTSRKLFRECLLEFGNAFVASEMVLVSAVQRVALERDIPLVFWGENPALQVGDQGTLGANMWDGNRLRDSNTLKGGDISWMRKFVGLDTNLSFYQYPAREYLSDAVQTIFLGPAWDNWYASINSTFALLHGFSGSDLKPAQSGDLYQTEMVDEPYFSVNHWLKYLKYGFGRGSDQANQLIRLGRITREEGALIARKMDPVLDSGQLDSFLDYAEIKDREWREIVQRFRNPYLFDLQGDLLVPRFLPGVDAEIELSYAR